MTKLQIVLLKNLNGNCRLHAEHLKMVLSSFYQVCVGGRGWFSLISLGYLNSFRLKLLV